MNEREVIKNNLRLVTSIARNYFGKGVDIEDLIQEGTIALIEAYRKFDEKKGCKFTTYAYPYIKQAIIKAICNQNYIIRKPIHLQEKIRKMQNIQNKLSIDLNREPKVEEISKIMHCKKETIIDLINYYSSNFICNIDEIIDEENYDSNEYEKETLMSYIPSPILDPEQIVIAQLDIDYISSFMKQIFIDSNLTERELEILKLRYGFNKETLTLEQIGKIYQISKERVRQIEKEILKKIKTTISLKKFYLNYDMLDIKNRVQKTNKLKIRND